jgi:hypothetical protein
MAHGPLRRAGAFNTYADITAPAQIETKRFVKEANYIPPRYLSFLLRLYNIFECEFGSNRKPLYATQNWPLKYID